MGFHQLTQCRHRESWLSKPVFQINVNSKTEQFEAKGARQKEFKPYNKQRDQSIVKKGK